MEEIKVYVTQVCDGFEDHEFTCVVYKRP